mgnify:CR=1 FL=1
MRCVERDLHKVFESRIGKGKVIVLTGSRQVGKTTLFKKMIESFPEEKQIQFWNLSSWEFKYNPKKANTKCPLTFSNNYPNVPFGVITPDNYTDFIIGI